MKLLLRRRSHRTVQVILWWTANQWSRGTDGAAAAVYLYLSTCPTDFHYEKTANSETRSPRKLGNSPRNFRENQSPGNFTIGKFESVGILSHNRENSRRWLYPDGFPSKIFFHHTAPVGSLSETSGKCLSRRRLSSWQLTLPVNISHKYDYSLIK